MGAQGQARATEDKGNDTLNSRVVPVVFVPGVMGSRLDIGALVGWDPDDTVEMVSWVTAVRRENVSRVDFATSATVLTDLNGVIGTSPFADITARPRLREIALDQMNPKPPGRAQPSLVVRFWADRGWGGLVWSFYGQILMDLAEKLNPGSHGGELRPVYAFGYDWRQSNVKSGAALRARIKEILAKHPLAKQVIVVTHSMGGLVTRAALLQGAESDILGVVHTVMPADGAVVAYSRMLTGARKEHGDLEFGLRRILGPTRIQYLLMMSVLRGPTELLPGTSYPEQFFLFGGLTNKDFLDVFEAYARQEPPGVVFKVGESELTADQFNEVTAADVSNLRTRLTEAKGFTLRIAGKFHPKTFLLFGDGLNTVTKVDFNKGKATPSGAEMEKLVNPRPPAGDGTVPRASAKFEACRPLGTDSAQVEHGKCFADGGFRTATIDRVKRLLALPP